MTTTTAQNTTAKYALYIVSSVKETAQGARIHTNGTQTFKALEDTRACYEHKLETSKLDAVEIYGWTEETGDVLLARQPTRHHVIATSCEHIPSYKREEISRRIDLLYDSLASAHETYKARLQACIDGDQDTACALWAQMNTCAEALAELDRAKADIAQDKGARAFGHLELVQAYLAELHQAQEVKA